MKTGYNMDAYFIIIHYLQETSKLALWSSIVPSWDKKKFMDVSTILKLVLIFGRFFGRQKIT